MAELADALDSKSGIRKDVWVRPPPSAPIQCDPKDLSYRVQAAGDKDWAEKAAQSKPEAQFFLGLTLIRTNFTKYSSEESPRRTNRRQRPNPSLSSISMIENLTSGQGGVRHQDGTTAIEAGDAFIFKPGEPHQITNDGQQDLILYVVADNPIGESGYFPDSKKWLVRSPERRLIRSEALEYYDGEE